MSPQAGGDVLERLQALQDRIKAKRAAEARPVPTVDVEDAGLAPEPSYTEGVRSRVGRGIQGFSEMTAGTALGLAAFSARKAGAENVARFFERGKEGLSEAAAGVYEEQRAKVDAFQRERGDAITRMFEQTLPETAGGALGFAAGGGVLGGTKAALAGVGASQSAVQLYYEAKAHGADESTSTKAFLFGLPIGASEAFLGFGKRLSELDKVVGGKIGQRLVRIALDSGEEGVQEVLQQLAGNATAQGLYDPQRGWAEGVTEAGAAALILGALGGGAAQVAQATAPTQAAPSPADAQVKPPIDKVKAPEPQVEAPVLEVAPAPPPTPVAAPGGTTALVPGGAQDAAVGAGVVTLGPSGTIIEPVADLEAQADAYLAGERGMLFVDRDPADPELAEFTKARDLRITPTAGGVYLTKTGDRGKARRTALAEKEAATPEDRERIRAEALGYERAKPDLDQATTEVRETLDEQGRVVSQEAVDAASQPAAEGQRDVPLAQALAKRIAPPVGPPAEAAPASAKEPMAEGLGLIPEAISPTPPQSRAAPVPKAPTEVSAFPGGLLKIPGVREFASGVKRNLTSKGHLPAEAFEADIKRKAAANAEIQGIHDALRDFHRAVKADTGKTPNDLPPAQLARIDQVLKGGTSLTLQPRVREAVTRMRDNIDRMSRRLIQSGAIEASLIPHVQANLGFYTTRSYRVYDDPKWAETVDDAVKNKAKAFIRQEYPNLTPEEVDGKIASLLYQDKAADEGPLALVKRGKLGSKDLSLLTRRKTIAPEIRALYGEYKDPRINYAKSVVRMANLIANHQFLETVRAQGLGSFLRERPTVENGIEYKKKIAADESSVMSPLNGLYTTPEIDQAFQDVAGFPALDVWMRALLALNAAAKISKTALNPASAQRNLIFNTGFAIAQGHWRAWKMIAGIKSVGTKWGITDTLTDRMVTLASQPVAKWRAHIQNAIKHGVMLDDVRSGEIRDAIRDMAGMDANEWMEKRAAHAAKLPLRAALEYYRVGDDIWKLYAWENENARYAKAKPSWSQEQVEAHTARIVRNTWPTYSLVPRLVKLVRRIPVVGPFLSFPAEVVRNAGNTIALIKTEMADPDLRGIGAQRIVGSLTAASLSTGAALALRALYGITADDDDDAREFVPPWSKNSDLLWVKWGEKGEATYIDINYSDPWGYLREPLLAFMRGDDVEEKLWEAFKAAADPLFSEELFSGALMDLRNNKTKTGGEVYNPAASWNDKTLAIGEHLFDSLKPGAFDAARRIKMGVTGEKEAYGRQYDPAVEALAVFTGVRLVDLDPVQALNFRAGDYSKARAQGSRLGTSVLTRQGTVSDDDIRNAIESADTARSGAYEDMRAAVRAALNLGVPEPEAFASLRSGGLSEDEARRLLSVDEPEPWHLSTSTRKDMSTTLGDKEARRRIGIYEAMRKAEGTEKAPALASQGR